MEKIEVRDESGDCIRISKLIMGTDHLGRNSREAAFNLLDEAAALGINTFDTAPIYVGDIEKTLGDWLNLVGHPELYNISKGGFPYDRGPGAYESRLKGSRKQIVENIKEEIEGSYKRLNNDITVYLMHRDDVDFQDYAKIRRSKTHVKTILEALSSHEIRSKYKMLGLSNWETPRIGDALSIADEHSNLVRPMFTSPYFSLMEMKNATIHSGGVQVKHMDMMNPDFQPGIQIMPYSPLGGFGGFDFVEDGWEAAKQKALDLKRKNDRYWRNAYDAVIHVENEQRIKRAENFTRDFNRRNQTAYTLDQIMNAYVLAHPRTDFLIIGPLTIDQLRRTVESLQVAAMLTHEDLDYLYNNPD